MLLVGGEIVKVEEKRQTKLGLVKIKHDFSAFYIFSTNKVKLYHVNEARKMSPFKKEKSIKMKHFIKK